jgi:ATP-binding cassette subfamily B protein
MTEMVQENDPLEPLFRPEVMEAQRRASGPGEPLRLGPRRGLTARLRGTRVPFIAQMEVTDCGAACLAMSLALHGRHVPLEEVRHVTGTDREGVDALALSRAARHFGLRARGVRLEPASLPLLEPGSILHWDLNHFVVLEKATAGGAVVVDPGIGRRKVSMETLGRSFTGVALELEPGEDFAATPREGRNVLRHLAPVLMRRGLLASVIVSSALVQVFALALPILTAVVVDRVVPRSDRSLLLAVTLGLGAMVLFNLLASYLRARQLLYLRTRVDLQISRRFIEHLADLPYPFFLQRSTGDLMMRLNSNATVREILTSSVLSGVLDGAAVVIYVARMMAT